MPPTDVVRPSEVAGNGPPCIIELHTSTPVGNWLKMTRPDLRLKISTRSVMSSSGPAWMDVVSWPWMDSASARSSSSSWYVTNRVAGPNISSERALLLTNSTAVVRKTHGAPAPNSSVPTLSNVSTFG